MDGSKGPQLLEAVDVDRLEVALWIYDFEHARIRWANQAGLALWSAESLEALGARDLRVEMSASVQRRLQQHRAEFEVDPNRTIRESWTLYPEGKPLRVRAILRRHELAEDSSCMLVEARAEALREPEQIRSADALLHTQVMTALFDRAGDELYANPAFRAAFGPGRRRFGQEFVSAADLLRFGETLATVGEYRATVPVVTVQGERWHDVHAVRCRDAMTGDGAFVVSATDVTAARTYAEQLVAARDAAEAASRAKARFLSMMSHEMRTPLNGVLGMANVLAHTALDETQRRHLDVVVRSGIDMLRLIEDVLELVQLDAGAAPVVVEPYNPQIALTAAVEACRRDAEAKGLRLEVEPARLGGRSYRGDASRIGQVLRQLVGNAIKFTDEGGVVARVRLDERARLRFEIADTGPGVPAEDQEAIFERFRQLDGTETRRKGGVGLGLSICREIVALLGGEIGVDSVESRGSTFWFATPAEEAR